MTPDNHRFDWEPHVDFTALARELSIENRFASDAPIVAFDLDETLIVNSYVDPGSFKSPAERITAWKPRTRLGVFNRLRQFRGQRFIRPVLRLARNTWEPVASTVDVRLRRESLGILHFLRQRGVCLVLVTASKRQRVRYLASRLGDLFDFFADDKRSLIICAEDIADAVNSLGYTGPSLAQKTPEVSMHCLGDTRTFNLLVDDNEQTKAEFESRNIASKLVSLNGRSCFDSDALLDRLPRILQQLQSSGFDITGSLTQAEAYLPNIRVNQLILEDPYYLPLLQRQLDVASVDCA